MPGLEALSSSRLKGLPMTRGTRSVVLVAMATLALGASGCGSSKKTGSHSSRSSRSAGNYHRGEFCSKRKKSTYKKAGYKCKKVNGVYRLQ